MENKNYDETIQILQEGQSITIDHPDGSTTSLFQIKNKLLQNYLNKILSNLWGGVNRQRRYFAPQPLSLEEANFPLLKHSKFDYSVCVKYNGLRFLCTLTSINNIPLNLLVNRKFEWFIVDQHFKAEVYSGTYIFDGELLSNETFIIHDAFLIHSKSIIHCSLEFRIQYINNILVHFYVQDSQYPKNTFTFKLKQFYTFASLNFALKEMHEAGKLADGLIFYPNSQGVFGSLKLYKWKPGCQNTVDFIVRQKNDLKTLELYCRERGQNKLVTKMSKSDFTEEFNNNSVYEFTYDPQTKHFLVKCERKDKDDPNSFYTMQKTIQNVLENITEDDLRNI